MFIPWPILLGGSALGGLYLLGRDHVDEPAPTEQPRRRQQPAPTPPPKPRPSTSPLAGVTREQWIQFMRTVGDPDNVNGISKTGHLGFFRFSYPRLADLGIVVAARRDGKRWTGDFAPPITGEQFLGDLGMQCRAFALSSGDFATHLREAHEQAVGADIEGQPATLSGLLAVLHRAGHKGFDKWVMDAEDRKRYPNTTAAYKAANGIF